MRRLAAVLALAAVTATTTAGSAHAARRHDQLPLHLGSAGSRVTALQWMLSGKHGHRPNVFTVAGTFHGKPTGYFGRRTAAAVYAYKYRLGYPAKWNSKRHPIAGALFFKLLEGHRTRPATWVRNAAARVTAITPGATNLALAIKAYEISQLGVNEQPLGSNWGSQVAVYQADTGAYHAAWCVSFTQHSFRVGGYGHFADDTASVYYAVDWAAARNYLHATPKVGAIVAFIDYDRYGHRIPGTGHMGTVVKLTASGFSYIAGNDANGVNERYITFGARPYVFVWLPGVT